MKKTDYIIDFDRVNELTTIVYSDRLKQGNAFSDGNIGYTLSRKMISDFLNKFTQFKSSTTTDEEMNFITETLVYNKILITKADIRDTKITKVLNEESDT